MTVMYNIVQAEEKDNFDPNKEKGCHHQIKQKTIHQKGPTKTMHPRGKYKLCENCKQVAHHFGKNCFELK